MAVKSAYTPYDVISDIDYAIKELTKAKDSILTHVSEQVREQRLLELPYQDQSAPKKKPNRKNQ